MHKPAAYAGRCAPFCPALTRVSAKAKVIARNQYDLVRNTAFLTCLHGRCPFSPAFDINSSYKLQAACAAIHQMTSNGKRDTITLQKPRACAKSVVIKLSCAAAIVEQVRAAVAQSPMCAGRPVWVNCGAIRCREICGWIVCEREFSAAVARQQPLQTARWQATFLALACGQVKVGTHEVVGAACLTITAVPDLSGIEITRSGLSRRN